MIKALVTGASDDGIGGGIARELARLAAADVGGALMLSTSGRRGAPLALLRDIEAAVRVQPHVSLRVRPDVQVGLGELSPFLA